MGAILDKITEAIKEMLIGMIESNLTNMFTDVNDKVGTIAAEVGQTPSGWNSGIYSMIRGLSESVIIPIAGIIITFVLCYELITMITERNNLHDVDTWMFFKWFFKAFVAIYLVTNTFDIVMAVFDIGQHVVSGAGGFISGSTNIDIASTLATMRTSMEAMGVGELLGLAIETLIISLCLKIMSILITVILYGRMIEIYCTVSVLLLVAGIVVCALWILFIRNYKKLNSAKFDVINRIERYLPYQPFCEEWEKLKDNKKYMDGTKLEKCLPIMFIALYAISAIIIIVIKLSTGGTLQ